MNRQQSPLVCTNKENKSPLKNLKTRTTPVSNEILSVAQRILSKKQTISALTTATNNSKANVNDIKSKFEQNSEPDAPIEMKPKLIIKKFEALLSRDQNAIASFRQRTLSNPPPTKQNNSADFKGAKLTPVSRSEKVNNERLNANDLSIRENVTPKSIIEKFEKLTRTGEADCNKATKENFLKESLPNPVYSGASTLTFVSSMTSDASPTALEPSNELLPQCQKDFKSASSFKNEEKYDEENDSEAFEEKESDDVDTSLFDESETDPTSNTQPTDTYSMSSSFTGSIINQDFDDLDETEDFSSSDIYSSFDSKAKSSTILKANFSECSKNATITKRTTTNEAEWTVQPTLFSIQEYRRQKKLGHSASRRSSVLRTNNKLRTETGNDELSVNDEASKRAKYLERIKELEELIKQEDNVIHQTGIALERCLTDNYFTGSSEHIECNRIILISCQKRQAFLTEISRLKQLLSSQGQVGGKRPTRVDSIRSESESLVSMDEISACDLTGLLIFSDIQLPIKESYLNRLKCGEGKELSENSQSYFM